MRSAHGIGRMSLSNWHLYLRTGFVSPINPKTRQEQWLLDVPAAVCSPRPLNPEGIILGLIRDCAVFMSVDLKHFERCKRVLARDRPTINGSQSVSARSLSYPLDSLAENHQVSPVMS
jgi:hypothetical protein